MPAEDDPFARQRLGKPAAGAIGRGRYTIAAMRRWSEVAERVAATTRTSEKTALLADYLAGLTPDELPIAVVFLDRPAVRRGRPAGRRARLVGDRDDRHGARRRAAIARSARPTTASRTSGRRSRTS